MVLGSSKAKQPREKLFTFNGREQAIRSTEPLALFTDGILAITATILVIQLEVSKNVGITGLRHALWDQWPTFAAVVIGYLWLAASWINTRRLRRMLCGMDHWATVLYLFTIFSITLIPFVMLGLARTISHPDFPVGVQLLACLSLANGILVNALLEYCRWRGLGTTPMTKAAWRAVRVPNFILTGCDVLAVLLAPIIPTVVIIYITADWLYALLPLFTDHEDHPANGADLIPQPVDDD